VHKDSPLGTTFAMHQILSRKIKKSDVFSNTLLICLNLYYNATEPAIK